MPNLAQSLKQDAQNARQALIQKEQDEKLEGIYQEIIKCCKVRASHGFLYLKITGWSQTMLSYVDYEETLMELAKRLTKDGFMVDYDFIEPGIGRLNRQNKIIISWGGPIEKEW